ncbi:Bgt-55092 [Blumeria graminis f. sp. tritici]|uniref:Bgt-55000 n=1 Tax=Blumeria graminis f. sp. tritici TaxID=62690 RepID=A0A9X9MG14_BLUGR|nr:Bgt-55000 [Blumeria graminis f. sp. tritici]VDB85981.1 Bgt-55092 [Blumeria graminis f. sp. tritici]
MEGVVVRLLVVFSGIVSAAWAPPSLERETSQITFRAEKCERMMEVCLDNPGLLRRFPGWVLTDEG